MKRDMMPKASQRPPKLAQSVTVPGSLSAGFRASRAGVCRSLEHKFFDFSVARYTPHPPQSGARHHGEDTVWEWKKWRLAPKKQLILSPSLRPLAPAGCGVWFPTAAAGSAAAPSLGGNLRGTVA